MREWGFYPETIRNKLWAYKNGFPISREQQSLIDSWIERHINEVHNGNDYAGVYGGMFTYIFKPTSIDTSGTIKCDCGAEFEFQKIE